METGVLDASKFQDMPTRHGLEAVREDSEA